MKTQGGEKGCLRKVVIWYAHYEYQKCLLTSFFSWCYGSGAVRGGRASF